MLGDGPSPGCAQSWAELLLVPPKDAVLGVVSLGDEVASSFLCRIYLRAKLWSLQWLAPALPCPLAVADKIEREIRTECGRCFIIPLAIPCLAPVGTADKAGKSQNYHQLGDWTSV